MCEHQVCRCQWESMCVSVDSCWWYKQFASPTWENRKQDGVKRFLFNAHTYAGVLPTYTCFHLEETQAGSLLCPVSSRKKWEEEERMKRIVVWEGEKKRVWEMSTQTSFTAVVLTQLHVEKSRWKTHLPGTTPLIHIHRPLFDTRKAKNTQFISIHSVFKTGKTSCSSF